MGVGQLSKGHCSFQMELLWVINLMRVLFAAIDGMIFLLHMEGTMDFCVVLHFFSFFSSLVVPELN